MSTPNVGKRPPPSTEVPPEKRTPGFMRWADQEPESGQSCAGQRGEERPVLRSKSWASVAELSLQDGELVAQGEDLDVVLAVGHRR
jgi:hypothetical protein